MIIRNITEYLEQFAPLQQAENWDNVGLLLGDSLAPVQRIMTCLTVTPTVVAEAIAERANLIVSHHPILFKAVQRLTTETADGRLLLPLLTANVAVYSPHTAFDNCVGGINDLLCQRLGLIHVVPLRPANGTRQFKLVVFLPESDLTRVSEALFKAGAGIIGKYEQCGFRSSGIGSFFGTESSNPTIGRKGHREDVPEWRLETVCPGNRLAAALAALKSAHSYEEPAYDVYPLEALTSSQIGSGRLGRLTTPMSLREFSELSAQKLGTSVQTVGNSDQMVQQITVVCGAGSSLMSDAIRAHGDVFLTGEMRFHDQLAAQTSGISVVLAGHYATERPGIEMLALRLQKDFPSVDVWASRAEQDPVTS